jgi:hypothetical protein
MTYFHIRDFDEDQVKVFSSFHGENALSRYFKDYYGLKYAFRKFCKLMANFQFMSVRDADKLINWENQSMLDF